MIPTNVLVAFDVSGKLSFGKQIGFLEHGSDFNGLIKTQSAFAQYVDIVRRLIPHLIGPPSAIQTPNMPILNTLLLGNPIFRLIVRKPSTFANFCRGLVQERLKAEKS